MTTNPTIGKGKHDDGLWPDFGASAESSTHENLPNHFGEDNLFPDEDVSTESVSDGANVLSAQHEARVARLDKRGHVDGTSPTPEESVVSVQEQIDGPEGADDSDSAESGNEAPAKSASKGDWEDYAVSQGVERGQAEEMTKAELQKHLGH